MGALNLPSTAASKADTLKNLDVGAASKELTLCIQATSLLQFRM